MRPIQILKKLLFYKLNLQISRRVIKNHPKIARLINKNNTNSGGVCSELISSKRLNLLNHYHQKYQKIGLRLLVYIPNPNVSPAGYSIFKNLADGMRFMGVKVETYSSLKEFNDVFNTFQPNLMLISDHESNLKEINWDLFLSYKRNNYLQLGLTAAVESYGAGPLNPRLEWAEGKVDFYFSFRSQEYIRINPEYLTFSNKKFDIHTIEFSANPLIHYPIQGIDKTLDYVFLGSCNTDKAFRYSTWFKRILSSQYSGFINGPGWFGMNNDIDLSLNKYLYGSARVGLNLHLKEQTKFPSELNERTYVLAACGVPQLIDNPLLLRDRFSNNAFFEAANPKEYFELFKHIINNPTEAQIKSECALLEVYEKHTLFHRIEQFLKNLKVID